MKFKCGLPSRLVDRFTHEDERMEQRDTERGGLHELTAMAVTSTTTFL
jgi:hypothetical protein